MSSTTGAANRSATPLSDYAAARLISRILIRYYRQGQSQAAIGQELGLSTAKVNRLIKRARQDGLVEISIHTPFESLLNLEAALCDQFPLQEALVAPHLSDDSDALIETLGEAAADHLLAQLRDGDTLCISGGRAVQSVVKAIRPERQLAVRVVPATGGIQGRHHSDVNYLASALAERLGGEALHLHAPILVDTPDQRDAIQAIRQIREVLEMARNADVALLGVGSIEPQGSSYLGLTNLDPETHHRLLDQHQASGAILARLYDAQGEACATQLNRRIVGLSLAELARIPTRIGVAAEETKTKPLRAALTGAVINHVVTEQQTAERLLCEPIS